MKEMEKIMSRDFMSTLFKKPGYPYVIRYDDNVVYCEDKEGIKSGLEMVRKHAESFIQEHEAKEKNDGT